MAQLPISQFLIERLTEYDPSFNLRKGTAFESLFFKPLEYIVQPLRDEANDVFIGQSFSRILEQDDPDAFDTEVVDALASNLFVPRRTGSYSNGTARVLYNEPMDREYPAGGAVFVSASGDNFSNPSPFKITSTQMSTQIKDGLYYFEIPIQSNEKGDIEVDVNGIVDLLGDDDIVRTENDLAFTTGVATETNTEFIKRVQNSIGVRDLVAGKGFNAILNENFSSIIQEVQPVGFGDLEMMRDVVYNTHIGGRVDGYIKTFSISQGFKDFVGLLIDTTRQTPTSSNVLMEGLDAISVGQPNIDRSNGKAPIVKEIKVSTSATFKSLVDFSSPVNLSTNQHIRVGVDGNFLDIRVAGVVPAATTRNEVVNIINNAFGYKVAFTDGNTFSVKSPTSGLTSTLTIMHPTVGNSAVALVFGLIGVGPFIYNGDGPVTFVEGQHYTIDDAYGKISRIVGPTVLSTQTTGETTEDSDIFVDATFSQFLNVEIRDIITILSGDDAGDYRVLGKTDNNTLILDKALTTTASGVSYIIRRTGIKDQEMVYVTYYFNPLSIDINKYAVLDEYGRERGIRPDRDEQTITDLVFLRIRSIEIINPVSKESTGQILDGIGGYGQGGYGRGGYGIGDSAEYRIVVVKPEVRFSMFEESYILLNSGLAGLSFRVNYDYVPEIEEVHNFVRSANERILDGDILMKHFLPVYVSGTISYRADSTNSSIPTNDELTTLLKDFINRKISSGSSLEYSDIIQFILRNVDPYDKYSGFVNPFTLEGTIHNTDGTITKITGTSRLEIPQPDPFPSYTTRPLTPRITHWISEDIVLERISDVAL
jgi:hypothetical protein